MLDYLHGVFAERLVIGALIRSSILFAVVYL
jgi:hypothetical protein